MTKYRWRSLTDESYWPTKVNNRLILCLKPSESPSLLQANLPGLLCVDHIATFFVSLGPKPLSGVALLLLLCSSLVCCCSNEEEGASFYRWRRGGIWKMLHRHMEGTKPTSKYSEPRWHHHTDIGQGGKQNRPSLGPNGSLDCLLCSPRHGPWWCPVKIRWFGWDLALFSIPLGPESAGKWAISPWAYVGCL